MADASEVANGGQSATYLVRLADSGTTIQALMDSERDGMDGKPENYSLTGELTIDGEKAETFTGKASSEEESGYLEEFGTVVSHSGQAFVIIGVYLGTTPESIVTEADFKAFCDGIRWAK